MPKVEKTVIIAAPAAVIWEFTTDPSQWHTWFEGLSEAKSIAGDGSVGTVVEHRITVYNIPMPIQTTVVAFDPGVYWKSEFTGPMSKGVQEWKYRAVGEGTEIQFVIDTEFSGPAKLAQKMVVNAFDKMADKMLANVKEGVEA